MKKLVLASGNPSKLRELSALLANSDYQVCPQSDFEVSEVAETGTTFVENAIIKARHAAQQTNHASLADDSGIVVDALNGEPGVYSARFAGSQANDDANNTLLVEKLSSVPEAERSARYKAVIVYMRNAVDPCPIICEGSWEGIITLEAKGSGGFGYDPYFYLPDYGCTSAELSADEKNRVSHRGQALRLLLERLPQSN
jgi:XTP/dITP diphosphohydrolase